MALSILEVMIKICMQLMHPQEPRNGSLERGVLSIHRQRYREESSILGVLMATSMPSEISIKKGGYFKRPLERTIFLKLDNIRLTWGDWRF